MSEKRSKAEEEYFAREEAEKLHRLHQERLEKADEAAREELKKQHWMHCPKCGWDLETIKWRGVDIEKCFHCGVVVLDDGELEKLAGQEDEGLLGGLFGLFSGTR